MTEMQGSWVWYELMTPDADGAKAFYDKVVGWTIQTTHGGGAEGNAPGETPYGFIANADGSMTGGVLHLDDAMREQGARPCWMGYIGVDDVDAALVACDLAGMRLLVLELLPAIRDPLLDKAAILTVLAITTEAVTARMANMITPTRLVHPLTLSSMVINSDSIRTSFTPGYSRTSPLKVDP